MKIKEYFKQPYPANDNAWKNIAFISVFIPVFLIMFQPFGMSLYENKYKALKILGYGGVTFVVAAINQILLQYIFKKTFSESNWTIGKNMLGMLYTIFTIGLGNYIYTSLVFSFLQFDISQIVIFQIVTLMVAVIPVGLITTLRYNTLLAKNLKIAREINIQLPNQKLVPDIRMIRFSSENEKDIIEIAANDFLYIESNGNYLEINYIEEGKLKTSSVRSTLKRAEASMSVSTSIVKCHRAFYVNINKIKKVNGNSQGYKLCIEHTEKEIPVARNYSKTIKELLSPSSK